MSDETSICDLASVSREQDRVLGELKALCKEMGKAKAIKEISSDRRKQILSRLVAPLMEGGDSAAAAEHKARQMDSYDLMLTQHQEELSDAEEVIARFEYLKAAFEGNRTKMSTQRSLIELK